MNHYVYILENNAKNRHYIGYTIDIEKRLTEHNKGMTRSTMPFGPWKCIYWEEYPTRSEALKREWHLKHSAGRKEKLEIIKQYKCNNLDKSSQT